MTDDILTGFNKMVVKHGNNFQHRLYGNGDAGEKILSVLQKY